MIVSAPGPVNHACSRVASPVPCAAGPPYNGLVVGENSGSRGSAWLPFLAGRRPAWRERCSRVRSRPGAASTSGCSAARRGSGPAAGRGRARHPGQRAARAGRHPRLAQPAQRGRPPRPGLPFSCPSARAATTCVPGGLLGVDTVLPRLFGFTEYYDLAGAARGRRLPPRPRTARQPGALTTSSPTTGGATSWSRARLLDESLERAGRRRGRPRPALQPHRPQHGRPRRALLPALRHRRARPRRAGHLGGRPPHPQPGPGGGPQRAAASRRSTRSSTATGSASRTRRWPRRRDRAHAVDLPAPAAAQGRRPLVDRRAASRWTRPARERDLGALRLGALRPSGLSAAAPSRRRARDLDAARRSSTRRCARARAFHEALAARPRLACPARVVLLGGDCLPTLARALVGERPRRASALRAAETRAEAELHARGRRRARHAGERARPRTCPGPRTRTTGSAASPRSRRSFFGSADHHGIYEEPTFQSLLLRTRCAPLGARYGTLGHRPARSALE